MALLALRASRRRAERQATGSFVCRKTCHAEGACSAGKQSRSATLSTTPRADKNFELFIMPGQGHGVLSTEYGKRRLEDFFERTLGGA